MDQIITFERDDYVDIQVGDCCDVLQTLPSNHYHTCVTSPPYFNLRDYGMTDQIGLETTPDDYVAKLVSVFREVRRTLRDDGTLWLNLGDTYNNRRRVRTTSHQPSLNGFRERSWAEVAAEGGVRMTITSGGLKEKDALGIPWTVALALRQDGWYLRQEIIWAKTFGKPEPTNDRLAVRHEPIFLLSKSKQYYFDKASIPDWAKSSVWVVPPTGHVSHGATYPPDLIMPCILAGCPVEGYVIDPFGGSGTTGVVAREIGRKATLIELNPDYAEIARQRLTTA